MLPVQEFLQHKSFGDLIDEHGVYASLSKDGKLVSLNYDIDTKDDDKLSWDCRGLILVRADHSSFETCLSNGQIKIKTDCIIGNTKIAAMPFFRFFNMGQGAAQINWNDPKLSLQFKEDGTLAIVYKSPITNKWNMATRKVPEADLKMDNGQFTFRQLFDKAVLETTKLTFEQFTALLNPNYTYCFELCTPLNKIVVNYFGCGITLLAVRDLETMQEIDPAIFKDVLPVPQPRTYAYASMEEIANMVSSWDPKVGEGIVARDSHFNRIKIKNPAHALYNKMRDSLYSERNIMELLLLNKEDDILAMNILPSEITENIVKIKTGLQNLIKFHDDTYNLVINKADCKKDFAIMISKIKGLWTAPLFNRFDGKSQNIKDFIEQNRKLGTWGSSFLDRLVELSKNAAT